MPCGQLEGADVRQQLKLGDSETERKLTGTNILPAVRGTKGLSKSGKGLAGCRLAQPCRRQEAEGRRQEAGGRRQGGGERGKLGPRDGIPYHTANRPLVSNQRLPEILDGRHPTGGSRLNTRCMHPTGTRGNCRWDPGGEKAQSHPGECARQSPGCLSCSGG